MTTVLATYNIKGGVGKTSAAVETAIPASAEIERMGLERDIVASYARRGGAALAYEMPWGDVRRRLAEYPSRPV